MRKNHWQDAEVKSRRYESNGENMRRQGFVRRRRQIIFLIYISASAHVALIMCLRSDIVLILHNVSIAAIFLLREWLAKVMQNVIFHAAIARKGNFDVAG
ncbi:hypothetical protein HNQ68_001595 [Pseudochrobactrum saccharolyticum]|uniref:Uncharacterized protein n=1 Tax=Pseudochrobactrum saccharolyticum TaxID=354352 RepID=A0A7W8AIM4_9HYPH|nr:hypothetical protein [Pseudochrobactrum saccharolyticum]KAB0538941.1 hypothetical protein F7P81_07700 [Pseudochrobactrum saccharolyticum]MBB5091071.1 hypothetical protein [Pseudochrobactrum saccharolyticum]